MDRKAILAVALSLIIWVGWQKFYLEPIQQKAQLAAQQAELARAERAKLAETKAEIDSRGILPAAERQKLVAKRVAASSLLIENTDTKMLVSNEGFAVKSWELKSFSKTLDKREDRVEMVAATGFDSQIGLRFSDNTYTEAVGSTWDSLAQPTPSSAISKISNPLLQVERSIGLDPKGFGATLSYKFKFLKEPPKYVFLDLYGSPKRENDHEGSIFGQAPDKVHVTYRDLTERFSEQAASHTETKESAAGVKWLGLDTRYFVLALAPQASEASSAGAQLVKDDSRGPAVRGSLVYPTNGKNELTVVTKAYFGPKELESLRSVDPQLVDTIDFGWTSFLAVPLLHSLKWLYNYVHNYGLAIIVLTFVIKMLLFPLTYKSMKSMSKIAKLQPQLNALREKFKDDKEKLNVEMMNFMKTNGYNPVGGCLPILIQMPIFFALYRVLFNSMELYQAPFFAWIQDLSSPDPFFITPVFLTGLMYLQQKLSPSTVADPMQQKMLQFMPVMFGVFMLLLPAGLNIYMVVNSAVSIAQQYVMNKRLGIVPGGGAAVVKGKVEVVPKA
jgi:YidC/Oxa1 family membrane protein insertase